MRMQVIDRELIAHCDVDQTLILHSAPKPGQETVSITDPYDCVIRTYVVNRPMIKLIKDHAARGYFLIVWSANGWQWAEAVAKALDLQDTFELCMGKNLKYFDDLQAVDILGVRVYLSE
jgi:hypothetical protein